jgi:transposase-like protein
MRGLELKSEILEQDALTRVMQSKSWSDEDGRIAVAAWKESGLSRAEFARQYGTTPHRLQYWSGKMAVTKTRSKPTSRSRSSTSVLQFHPLRAGIPTGKTKKRSSSNDYTGNIDLILENGITIRLGPDFDADALERLLEIF